MSKGKTLVTKGNHLVTEKEDEEEGGNAAQLPAGARIEGPVGPWNSSLSNNNVLPQEFLQFMANFYVYQLMHWYLAKKSFHFYH